LASFEHEVSWASFENEKNGTVVFDVPKPIIHPSWNEIDPTTCSIICQGLCPEGQNQGTASVIVSPLFLLQEIFVVEINRNLLCFPKIIFNISSSVNIISDVFLFLLMSQQQCTTCRSKRQSNQRGEKIKPRK
jgi:hypothetical protein